MQIIMEDAAAAREKVQLQIVELFVVAVVVGVAALVEVELLRFEK